MPHQRDPRQNAIATLVFAVGVLTPSANAQQDAMPAGMSHAEHMKQMNKRGNLAMGFDQEKVNHHFKLTTDGGSIQVNAKQTDDSTTRSQIREHLKMISKDFANGVFSSPIATHGEVPPGVAGLREKKTQITYSYEDTSDGARVVIRTADASALASLHDFLRYQIREHSTGDSIAISK
jgi:hypothetical protein